MKNKILLLLIFFSVTMSVFSDTNVSSNNQKVYCKYCGEGFNNVKDMTSPGRKCTKSKTNRHVLYEGTFGTKYYCIWCGREFHSLKHMASEYRINNGVCRYSPNNKNHEPYEGTLKTNYTCQYCGKTATSIYGLTTTGCIKSPCKRHVPAR